MLQKLKKNGIDIILLDLREGGKNNIKPNVFVSDKYPDATILSLAMNHEDSIKIHGHKNVISQNNPVNDTELLRFVKKMILNNTFNFLALIANEIKKVPNNKEGIIFKLTRREIEIIKFIATSMTNKEIAARLYLSEFTVKTHRQNIMKKLKVKNTAGLVKFAMDNGLI
jgi:DNA-binding NarL/FixJ family response regulator